ncbi:MAG: TetR/AcrR family transcriptional regulator [Hyphomicrobiaceae bacterium]|nr:TetR/AcrR family transcriptional regulator [Hyphomicrobiaceae bacterium]
MTDTLEQLLDTAESAIRLRGYHAVSFRELADDLGIKSASVHYYFRQKEDLGLALVERYKDRFFKTLEPREAQADGLLARVEAFCSVYRDALVGSDRICLCGMLGAESAGLPPALAASVADFFESNVKWLTDTLSEVMTEAEAQCKAVRMVATLQGAMMLASSLKNYGIFDDAAEENLRELKSL